MFLSKVQTLDDCEVIAEDIDELPVATKSGAIWPAGERKPWMFAFIFGCWVASLIWFGPRLIGLVGAAEGFWASAALSYFAVFTTVAWLYGLYNIGVVLFSAIYRNFIDKPPALMLHDTPPVAILYTTCNDFVRESVESCLNLSYPNYTLYILDDGDDPAIREKIDAYATDNPDWVKVIRRENRAGYKAGNLNHALANHVSEPYFAVVDADEIVPANFLDKLVPYLINDPDCGFVQANHRCDEKSTTKLQEDMRIGIDVHWKWYQPLRNKFGFVMFLGHGALLRRSCWDEVGGFDEIVSEDLAYAISIREKGYYGVFAEDVMCIEAFPESVKAFRVRHVKWTRGTCEFLHNWVGKLWRSRNIPLIEKLDITFPTANLPLTLFFFLFMVIAGLALPFLMGASRDLTWVILGQEVTMPVRAMPVEMTRIFTIDFFAITVMTLFAPILCFVLEHWREPIRLFRFLSKSTALYAALSPLSALCVVGYALTGKARFLVTGDKSEQSVAKARNGNRIHRFLSETHPDARPSWAFELIAGIIFFGAALVSFQPAFAGIALAFFLQPFLHYYGWSRPWLRRLSMLPFVLIIGSVMLGGFSFFGLQPVFFGFGFHF